LPGIIIAHQEGYKLSEIAKALENLGPIESRFEFIENDLGINIVIDFAHTPKAFDNIFSAIPKDKNIIAVYGMSGDRTKEIRQKVGEISASHKVFSVVTTDDPKFDTYENIANDIVSGIVSQKGQYIKIKDRKEAIAYAIKKAEPGDFLLLLGKGEEHFMKLDGNNKTYYNEKESVREILDKI
jgi:UDP-N-acetylmuramoyl-L-alanyl-D-glutamate--2,6-diaminopimelate ligase